MLLVKQIYLRRLLLLVTLLRLGCVRKTHSVIPALSSFKLYAPPLFRSLSLLPSFRFDPRMLLLPRDPIFAVMGLYLSQRERENKREILGFKGSKLAKLRLIAQFAHNFVVRTYVLPLSKSTSTILD